MLAALLATKPALDDVTYESRRPPLHLALLYGTPEIMDSLLAAGAKPNQRGDENRTPLDFLLNRDFEFAVRMTYLPRMVDRASMTQMVLALFKAGAAKPFADFEPDVADYLAWGPMVELTEGAAPLKALAATGSKPAYEDGLTALALAAYLGNAGAVPVLMELGPRHISATSYGETGGRDVWLDAAQAAVAGGHPDIAAQLLRKGMPFTQHGPQTRGSAMVFTKLEMQARPIMNLAARQGDVKTLQRLLELGAAVDGDPLDEYGNTPLAEAVQARKPDAVKLLLAAGADPRVKRDGYDVKSAVDVALEAGDAATLRQFADAGFDLKSLGANAIRRALENRDTALALMLIDAGASIELPRDSAGDPTPLLILAATSGQAPVVDALLAKRVDPAGLAPNGESALYWLIGRQDTAMLDRLLRAGAKLDDPRLPRAPARYALLNAAVASGDMALVQRVSQATGQRIADACVPERGELNLLDKPGVFAQLRAAGFTGEQGACVRDAAPLPQRIVSQLLHSRQLIVARQGEVVPMLQWVQASHGALDAVLDNGQTPLIAAIELGREDLADAMLSAGAQPDLADAAGRSPAWVALETGQPRMLALLARHHARFDNATAPPGQTFSYTLSCQSAPAFAKVLQDAGVSLTATCAPPAPRGSAKAASKSTDASGLPGHYSLRGVREVGSELLLSHDGSFDYIMSYGAVDISARGTWRSDGKQVFLDTPPIQPDSPIAAVHAEPGAASADPLTVRVYYRDRPVKIDVAMSSTDADYGGGPRSSEGADGVTAPIAPGTLKALSVFLPLPSGARWHPVDISKIDAGARAIRIDVEVPESAAGTPMHKTFTRQKDGALVESSAGRELRYEKE
jgi:ankyrin repeat protein